MYKILTTSSTEAEYVALMDTVKEAMWFRQILLQVRFPQTHPVRIYVDNKSAIDMACNKRTSLRTKHIDLKYHWTREQVEKRYVQLIHVPGKDNIADLLTKILATARLRHLTKNVMTF